MGSGWLMQTLITGQCNESDCVCSVDIFTNTFPPMPSRQGKLWKEGRIVCKSGGWRRALYKSVFYIWLGLCQYERTTAVVTPPIPARMGRGSHYTTHTEELWAVDSYLRQSFSGRVWPLMGCLWSSGWFHTPAHIGNLSHTRWTIKWINNIILKRWRGSPI